MRCTLRTMISHGSTASRVRRLNFARHRLFDGEWHSRRHSAIRVRHSYATCSGVSSVYECYLWCVSLVVCVFVVVEYVCLSCVVVSSIDPSHHHIVCIEYRLRERRSNANCCFAFLHVRCFHANKHHSTHIYTHNTLAIHAR